MPSVSAKQHRAMEAAAHGHSTLGIPKSVGQDFTAADAIKAGLAKAGSYGAKGGKTKGTQKPQTKGGY